MLRNKRHSSIAVLLAGILILSTGLEAGRQRLSTGTTNDEFGIADIEQELLFGRKMASRLLGRLPLIEDSRRLRYVNLIGQVLLAQATRPEIEFHFGIVKSDQINAYATPGGYVFVTTAALDQVRNEAELAAILAHEIAHVTQRHIVRALGIKAGDGSATTTIGNLVSSGASSAGVLFSQVMDQAFDILYSAGLKREDEFEADRLGVLLTRLAGYDAAVFPAYLERIRPLIESGEQQLRHTHPPLTQRIAEIEVSDRRDGLLQAGGVIHRQRFLNYMSGGIE